MLPPLEPPSPSRRLFWAVVGTCVGLFAFGAMSSLVLRLPNESMMGDLRLVRTITLEILLAAAWVPVLRRRGWSLRCITAPARALDLLRAVSLLVVWYVAYWLAFQLAAIALPSFQDVARSMQVGGVLSWWVVALVSIVNPVAEEFLYLGFITNVVKADGFQSALVAGVLARALVHVYQGPVGLVSAIAFGVIFGIYYLRSGRLWPIVVAHGVADLVALGRLVGGAA